MAALAPLEAVSVRSDDFADLDVQGSSLDLSVDTSTVEAAALSDCGDHVWFAYWNLSPAEDGGWGDIANGSAGGQGAIDEGTGSWTYDAWLPRIWAGGAPLDAYGIEAGDLVDLEISDHLTRTVADGSGVDPTSPHWTLWTSSEPGGDPSVALASGSVTFVSPEDP